MQPRRIYADDVPFGGLLARNRIDCVDDVT